MSQKTVLIVDDSRVTRMMIRSIINSAHADWDVIEAANGDDALANEIDRPLSLMILDYNMPGMDGVTLYEHLHIQHPEAKASLFTANIQKSLKDRVTSMGLGFVEKPITEDKVLSILQSIEV